MSRKWLLLGAAVLLLIIVYMVDHGRAASGLAAAYTVRDAGERSFGEMASGFSASGIAGVAGTSGNPEFALWTGRSKIAAASIHTPMFFGKDRVLAMNIAAKQYDELIRTPRGTWLTFTHEIADKRSRLDAAIIAVETQDVSAATREEMRALSETDITRISSAITDAHAKLEEKLADVQVTAAAATPSISDEERRAATARTLKEYRAETRIENSTPTADDVAREARENITPANREEQWALVVERCLRAGKSNCGKSSGKTEAENAQILAAWRFRNGLIAPAPQR